jgi:hypothetical protein
MACYKRHNETKHDSSVRCGRANRLLTVSATSSMRTIYLASNVWRTPVEAALLISCDGRNDVERNGVKVTELMGPQERGDERDGYISHESPSPLLPLSLLPPRVLLLIPHIEPTTLWATAEPVPKVKTCAMTEPSADATWSHAQTMSVVACRHI